jgi:murein DD-endopeptidase MepM/ murein hydrolase activator NlpD
MTSRIPAALAALLLFWSAPAAPAATTKEVQKARSERQALQDELDRAAAAYDAAQAKLARTQDAIDDNESSLNEAVARGKVVQGRLKARANVIYRRGPVGVLQFLVTSQSLGDFTRRVKLVEAAADKDATDLAAARRIQQEARDLRQQLEERKRQESQLTSTMARQTGSLTSNFSRAQALERKLASDREAQLREERERAARAAADAARRTRESARPTPRPATPTPSPSPTTARATPTPSARTAETAESGAVATVSRTLKCPVDGPTSFTDTFGAPRGGGRTHQGVDMFAAQGTPTVAITPGVILRKQSSAAGGLGVWLKGSNSTVYYYAHLSGYASIAPGQKVEAGDRVGFVGSTGNAAGGPPHLHFEVQPGGGAAINPYPTAARACGK